MLYPLAPYFKIVNNENTCGWPCNDPRRAQKPVKSIVRTDGQTDMWDDTGHIYPTAGSEIDNRMGSVNTYFLWRRQMTEVPRHFKCDQVWYTIRQLLWHTKGQEYLTTACAKHRTSGKTTYVEFTFLQQRWREVLREDSASDGTFTPWRLSKKNFTDVSKNCGGF